MLRRTLPISCSTMMAMMGEKSSGPWGRNWRMGASIGSVIWIRTIDTGSSPRGDMKDMSARPTTAMVSAHTKSWMNVWRKLHLGYPPSAFDFS